MYNFRTSIIQSRCISRSWRKNPRSCDSVVCKTYHRNISQSWQKRQSDFPIARFSRVWLSEARYFIGWSKNINQLYHFFFFSMIFATRFALKARAREFDSLLDFSHSVSSKLFHHMQSRFPRSIALETLHECAVSRARVWGKRDYILCDMIKHSLLPSDIQCILWIRDQVKVQFLVTMIYIQLCTCVAM